MVTVYGTATCMPCRSTKKYLDKNAIPYTFVDVSMDADGHEKISSLGYQSVPVVVTASGEHWQGFQPDRLGLLA